MHYLSTPQRNPQDYWDDRILGTNKSVRLPITNAFAVTGNNLAMDMDTARRVVISRLVGHAAFNWSWSSATPG